MSSTNKQSQQYELKLGVIHHPSLKTIQLIQFLENQANEFLHHDLPQYVKGDQRFLNVMESLTLETQQISFDTFEEYVGLLLIYSTSSEASYQYFLKNLQQVLQLDLGDLFLICIEMDNSDKQANLIGNEGEKYCKRNGLQFVRLSLYNSEDLINLINKSLYELIENYYYPNEEGSQTKDRKIEANVSSFTPYSNTKPGETPQPQQQYILTYDSQSKAIKAFTQSPSKEQIQSVLSHADELRKSRQKEILLEEQQIDESISNIQNVLNNINHRIKEKLESGWFTQIKNKLYLTAEKDNQNFSKIKLTQQFIDEDDGKRKPLSQTGFNSRLTDTFNQTSKSLALNFNMLKFNASATFKPALTRLVFYFSQDKVVELDVYENSTYDELASIALRRLGLRQTQRNVEKMVFKIKKRVQSFSKEFQRAIKLYEEKKIQQRTFLRSKMNQEQQ